MSDTQHHRPIRSFVLRAGRMTSGQIQAMERHWVDYGLDLETALSIGRPVHGCWNWVLAWAPRC